MIFVLPEVLPEMEGRRWISGSSGGVRLLYLYFTVPHVDDR